MDKLIGDIYTRISKDSGSSTDISLLTGSAGKILFLAYLYHATKDPDVKLSLENLIEHTLEILSSQEINFTFGGGVTGFSWVINHLYRYNLLHEDSEVLKDIMSDETDHLIAASLIQDFESSKYDPLYGYIGKGLYFLSKTETRLGTEIIERVLAALFRDKVIVGEQMITWIDVRRKFEDSHPDNERIILGDCGQAHGVAGIISFLCAVVTDSKLKKLKQTAVQMIRPAVNWLLAQQFDPALSFRFLFPVSVNMLNSTASPIPSGRLGWCYGDNIIALMLYKVALVLNDEALKRKADEIVYSCCQIPFEETGVFDLAKAKDFNPTLCHGAAGIAEIYRQIAKYNPSTVVAEAKSKWNSLTLEYTASYLQSGSLFSLFQKTTEATDFLYGYSGIGLYLISERYSNHGWQGCLLID